MAGMKTKKRKDGMKQKMTGQLNVVENRSHVRIEVNLKDTKSEKESKRK